MARTKKPKGSSRLAQMWQVFQMTRRYDKSVVGLLLLAFLLPTGAGVAAGLILSGGNVFTLVIWIVVGVMLGLLIGLIVLGRRAERAAYSQLEGQPGAVGAVMKSALKRSWIAEEMPVAINAKTKDAIYRAVGRGGVALIAEGPISRTQRLVDDEKRKTAKILPNVPITVLTVGPDEESVKLYKLGWQLTKIKPALTKSEVRVVSNRLASLGTNVPIPK
ncbi:MAG: DUF4191 family protein, partial [Aurantimicrobium sp.]